MKATTILGIIAIVAALGAANEVSNAISAVAACPPGTEPITTSTGAHVCWNPGSGYPPAK